MEVRARLSASEDFKMKGGSMDESIDLESLVNYHQFTGLERLVKFHQLITELECEPLGNMQVLAEESELVAAAKYFNEHYILPSIAELLSRQSTASRQGDHVAPRPRARLPEPH